MRATARDEHAKTVVPAALPLALVPAPVRPHDVDPNPFAQTADPFTFVPIAVRPLKDALPIDAVALEARVCAQRRGAEPPRPSYCEQED